MAIETSSNFSPFVIEPSAAETILLETGARLKQLRDAFGLSQRELAKRAGVTNSSISMIEQGQVSPSVQSLSRILAAFPVNLTDFFGFDPQVKCVFRADILKHNFEVRNLDAINSSPFSPTFSSIVIQNLTPQTARQLDARMEYLPPSSVTDFVSTHVDSCGLIADGELQITLASGAEILGSGDCFYVPALQPYRLANLSQVTARVFRCSLLTPKS